MAQVIVYTGPDGNVHVCTPTNEVLESHGIEWIKAKDTPADSIILESADLPQGADAQFFDAWKLNGNTVTVDLEKARSDKLTQFNAAAVKVAQKRQLNTLAGIANTPDDTTWQAQLASDRTAIAACTTTAQLLAIANPA